MKRIFVLAIAFYQRAVSPFLPTACRYSPSCSHYSKEAVEKYGAVKGSWMGIKRLGRCHPLGGKGYDPVP